MHGLFERLADKALVRHPGTIGFFPDGLEQRFRQPHGDAAILRLKLEVHRGHAGQVVIGQVCRRDKVFRRLIGRQSWQLLFHGVQPPSSRRIVAWPLATFPKRPPGASARAWLPMGLGQDRKPVSDPLSSFYGASTSTGAPRFPFPLLNAQPSGGLSVTLPGGGVGKLRRPQILP
jgi:hypothetical protein